MASKIFGIGMSRTGTTSLHRLLGMLGYESRHFIPELLGDPDADFAADAITDTPVPMLYRRLDARYPGSKFILTTRNKQAWLDSMEWMFSEGSVIWNWPKAVHDYHLAFYRTTRFDERCLSERYDAFHAEVNDHFRGRPGDLLLLDLDTTISVERICTFLNVPARNVAFPRSNERRAPTLGERVVHWATSIGDRSGTGRGKG